MIDTGAPEGEEGGACFSDETCFDDLVCEDGTCRAGGEATDGARGRPDLARARTDARAPSPGDAGVVISLDAAAPPRDMAAPPRDMAAPPRDMAAPPRDLAAAGDGSATVPPDGGAPPVDVDEQNGNFDWDGDRSHATALQSGVAHRGYISFVGDEDFYKISVPVKATVRVQITTPSATPYDLRFELTCPKRSKYLVGGPASGAAGPTRLEGSVYLNFPMSYYLFVHDDGDDEASPSIPYTVTVTVTP